MGENEFIIDLTEDELVQDAMGNHIKNKKDCFQSKGEGETLFLFNYFFANKFLSVYVKQILLHKNKLVKCLGF